MCLHRDHSDASTLHATSLGLFVGWTPHKLHQHLPTLSDECSLRSSSTMQGTSRACGVAARAGRTRIGGVTFCSALVSLLFPCCHMDCRVSPLCRRTCGRAVLILLREHHQHCLCPVTLETSLCVHMLQVRGGMSMVAAATEVWEEITRNSK